MDINDILFFKVFRNIIILKNIYRFIRIHNKIIQINEDVSTITFNHYTLKNFKFRDQLYKCRVGAEVRIEDLYLDNEKRGYYFDNSEDKDFFNILLTKDEESLPVGLIPESVTDLTWRHRQDLLDMGVLPRNIKTLTIANYFGRNKNIPSNKIPNHVQNFRTENTSVFYELPYGLRALSLLGRFNQALEELPTKLQYLELGYSFSNSINHLLPNLKNLKTLILGKSYKQIIKKGDLVDSIQVLSICCSFEEGSLPKSLRVLEIDSNGFSVASLLPDSIKCLIFKNDVNEKFNNKDLPESIEYLGFYGRKDFSEGFSFIPRSCKELVFGDSFNTDFRDMDHYNLPKLTHIIFGKNFNQDIPIFILPPTIKYIEFRNDYKMYKISNMPGVQIKKNIIQTEQNLIHHLDFLKKFIDSPTVFNNYILS
ncbi:hypothetical protein DICPUDRAFT_147963 [Dictyostelium purpureum]|uniref:FNIP repeat-containing protein n=1 Tax=Dictyostelium purpureum TaxID=5786 RepID=F0Z9W0_DICPU|nr:uncharacterized protein DICPUDRAFT_147963 [Dictyostelium purpureum]EGC39309.1 hypothetical protein DICPUDRAFT_147963 [Dictyostelium purpureum]|eukprot:XP_003284213.1 hypothetical protein DICPUDRAFT_147963 [Dictyostelium purpureum]